MHADAPRSRTPRPAGRLLVAGALVGALLGAGPPAAATATTSTATTSTATTAALPPGGIVPSVSGYGRTAGAFSVSPDGAARYTIPLWVPAGRGKVAPELSLAYDSRGGNGLLGVGWTLTGLSGISWCPRTIAQDGYTDGGHFDGADALCLGGARLIPVSAPQLPQRDYRIEQETFARITAFGTEDNVPDYFQVRTRDGRILTYGQTADSRVRPFLLQAGPDRGEPGLGRAPGNPRVTTGWALNLVQDRNGNSATVQYTQTEGDATGLWWSQLRPLRISYAPNRKVEFSYVGRTDPIDGFSGGTHTRTDVLLSRIEAWGGPQGGQAELLRQYRLAYDDSASITRRNLLRSVVECDGAGACKRPQTFDWSPGSLEFQEIDAGAMPPAAVSIVDADGDGRSDVVVPHELRRSTGTGLAAPVPSGLPSSGGVVPVDVDGGGRSEVLAEAPDGEQGPGLRWRLYQSNGTAFFPAPGNLGRWRPSAQKVLPAYLADLDGNGLPDFVETQPGPFDPDAWYYRLNTGKAGSERFAAGVTTTIQRNAAYFNFVVDTDGDGRAEVVDPMLSGPGASWGLNAAGGPENGLPNLWQSSSHRAHFGDVNGDGLKDFVLPHRTSSADPGSLRVQLNSGNGFGPRLTARSPSGYVAPDFSGSIYTDLGVRLADFDGDGHDDVVVFHPGPARDGGTDTGLQVYRWTGAGFARIPLTQTIGSPRAGTGWDNTDLLDIDGNGTLDLVNAGTDGRLRVFKRLGGPPDLITGIGAVVDSVPTRDRTEIDYTTLADRAVHTPGTCSYPQICLSSGGSVVAEHRTWTFASSGGAAGWDRVTHRYTGARSDAHGRGWLGVTTHTTTRVATGAATRTEFDNVSRDPAIKAYPYAGIPRLVTATVPHGTGGRESRTEATTELAVRRHPGGGWSVEPRAVTVVEQERAAGGSWTTLRQHATSTVFDGFGNADLSVSATVGGRTVVDDVDYRNDTAGWLLGLPVKRTTRACTKDDACTTRMSTMDYDGAGNPTLSVVEPAKPELTLSTASTYDQFGNVTSVTRTDGAAHSRQDRLEYADADKLHPTAVVNAAGHRTETQTHSGLGVPLRTTDPNGVATTMTYDRFGRPQDTNRADGSAAHVAYSVQDGWDVTTTTGADGSLSRLSTDELGRERRGSVQTFDGGLATVHTHYDPLGRLRQVSRPAVAGETPQYTTTEYDNRDRPVAVIAADGAKVRYEYVDRETHTYDARTVHSYAVTTVDGEIESSYQDDPESTGWLRTRFAYGPFGETTRTVAADGTEQVATYDVLGRRLRLDDPSAGASVSTYNAFGETLTETDGAGHTTAVERDLLGRVTRSTSPDGTATSVWDTAEHGKGRLARTTSTDGVTTVHTYTVEGKPAASTWTVEGTGYQISFGYDVIGRPAQLTYPAIPGGNNGRLKVEYAYSPSGYLLQIKDASAGTAYWTAEDRDSAGQLTRERLGNGVVGTRHYQATTGLLDDVGIAGPGVQRALAYGYDANRNVTSRQDSVGRTEEYGYDPLNRLRTWTLDGRATTFDYDRVGNLERETVAGRPDRDATYTYGGTGVPPHALTTRNGTRYGYDAAGRQITGAGRTIAYTQVGLPRTMTWGQGQRTDFRYDAAGSRVLKRDGGAGVVTIGGLFERRDPAGTGDTEIHNLHDIVADGRVVAQVDRVQATPTGPVDPTPRVHYLHADRQGSTMLVTNSAGRPADNEDSWLRELYYDPFGRRTQADGTPLGDQRRGGPRQGYTGHEHDDELGLVNMTGRIYDPTQRRFLTPDPLVADPLSSQAYNRYAYVLDNPVTLTDPTGLMPKSYGSRLSPIYPHRMNDPATQPQCDPFSCELSSFKLGTPTAAADDDQSGAAPDLRVSEYATVIAGAGGETPDPEPQYSESRALEEAESVIRAAGLGEGGEVIVVEGKPVPGVSVSSKFGLTGIGVTNRKRNVSKPSAGISVVETFGEETVELLRTKHLTVETKTSLAEVKAGVSVDSKGDVSVGAGFSGPTGGACARTCQPMFLPSLLGFEVDFCTQGCVEVGPSLEASLSVEGGRPQGKVGLGFWSASLGAWFEYSVPTRTIHDFTDYKYRHACQACHDEKDGW